MRWRRLGSKTRFTCDGCSGSLGFKWINKRHNAQNHYVIFGGPRVTERARVREAIKRSLSYATNQYAISRISLISLHVLGMWEIYTNRVLSVKTQCQAWNYNLISYIYQELFKFLRGFSFWRLRSPSISRVCRQQLPRSYLMWPEKMRSFSNLLVVVTFLTQQHISCYQNIHNIVCANRSASVDLLHRGRFLFSRQIGGVFHRLSPSGLRRWVVI